MQNFQDTFETRKAIIYSAFSICMTVPLNISGTKYELLDFYCMMSENGQAHFKNLALNAARFLKCV